MLGWWRRDGFAGGRLVGAQFSYRRTRSIGLVDAVLGVAQLGESIGEADQGVDEAEHGVDVALLAAVGGW
jgi:hypothetical protein